MSKKTKRKPNKKRNFKECEIKKKTKWYVLPNSDGVSWHVRRTIYLKNGEVIRPRMEAKNYEDFRSDKIKLDEYILGINYENEEEKRSKEKWKVQSAFIKSSEVNDEFYNYVFDKHENEKYARDTVSRFKRHVHDFFISQNKLDFKQWHTPQNQKKLFDSLKKKGLSVKTIKAVKDSVNSFYKFLHFKSDGQLKKYSITFPSLEDASTRKYEQRRRERKSKTDRRLSGEDYIFADIFKRIIKRAGQDIKGVKPSEQPKRFIPCFMLAYHYGLRRSESLGVLRESDIRKGYLHITKQRKSIGRTKKLKWNWIERKTPHFYTGDKLSGSRMKKNNMKVYELADVFDWVVESPDANPNQITKAWSHLMDDMELGFTIHNLRNTYISNLFRDMSFLKISVVDISLAVGHKSIRTTEKYLRDFRSFEDDIFKPKKNNVASLAKARVSREKKNSVIREVVKEVS